MYRHATYFLPKSGISRRCKTQSELDGSVSVSSSSSSETAYSADDVNMDEFDYDTASLLVVKKTLKRSRLLSKNAFKVFKSRWYICGVFSFYCFINMLIWNSYGPIAISLKHMFMWSEKELAFIFGVESLVFLICVFPAAVLVTKYNIRRVLIGFNILMLLGASMRLIPCDKTKVIYIHTFSQLFSGISSSLTEIGPPLISRLWFGKKERAVSTCLICIFSSLGIGAASIIGPLFMRDINFQNVDKESIYKGVTDEGMLLKYFYQYLYSQLGLCLLITIATVIYFPSKPKMPPSSSAVVSRVDYYSGFKKAIRSKNFMLVTIFSSILFGIYNGWQMVLPLNLFNTMKISQGHSGFLSFGSVIAGSVMAILITWIIGKYEHGFNRWIIGLCIFGAVSQLILTLISYNIINFNIQLVNATIIIVNMCVQSIYPLLYELSVEITFPISEEITTSLLIWVHNFVIVIFFAIISIPSLSIQWMHSAFIVSFVMMSVLLLVRKMEYHRLLHDQDDKLLVT